MSTEGVADDAGAGAADSDAADASGDPEVAARVEVLERENRRLRAAYRAARRTRYRRTAAGMAAVGVVAAAAGTLFPAGRTVLWALAGTGIFAAVLTYYLTPERFVSAALSERIYGALADNEREIADALGLQSDRVYIPVGDASGPGMPGVWLYVPQVSGGDRPTGEALQSVFVVAEDDRRRGISLRPTGWPLFEEFERGLAGDLGATPDVLVEQLVDAVVEQLEFADAVDADLDVDEGRVTLGVIDTAYGALDRFDHPIVSFFAVGLAMGLERPVSVAEVAPQDGGEDVLRLTWSVDDTGEDDAGDTSAGDTDA